MIDQVMEPHVLDVRSNAKSFLERRNALLQCD